MKNQYAITDPALYNGAIVFASFILIAVSIGIFIAIRLVGT